MTNQRAAAVVSFPSMQFHLQKTWKLNQIPSSLAPELGKLAEEEQRHQTAPAEDSTLDHSIVKL